MKRNSTVFFFKQFFLLSGFIFCTHALFAQIIFASGFEDAKVPNPPPGWVTSHTGNALWQSLEAIGYDGNEYSGKRCMYLEKSYYGDQADAWLISPSFYMEAGKQYSISFYYKNQSYLENVLQATLGDDSLASSQTEIIWSNNFKTNYYSKAQINYTATKTGTRYLGIHAITPQTYTYIYIDQVVVQQVSCFEPLQPTVTATKVHDVSFTWQAGGSGRYEYGISLTQTPPLNTAVTGKNEITISQLATATQYYFYVRNLCSKGVYSNWAIVPFTTAYDTTGIDILPCGTKFVNSFPAKPGLYLQPFCDDVFFGREFFHKFIPASSGMYTFNAYSVNTGQQMVYAYKEASLGAGPDGWTCIASTFGNRATYTFGPLQAGKEYLILEKAKAAPGFPSSYKYGIDCNAAASAFAANAVTANNVKASTAITAYPNPAKDKVTITITAAKTETYTVALTSSDGKTVNSFSKLLNAGTNQLSVNVANLAAGTYMLRLTASSGTQYVKILKQ